MQVILLMCLLTLLKAQTTRVLIANMQKFVILQMQKKLLMRSQNCTKFLKTCIATNNLYSQLHQQ